MMGSQVLTNADQVMQARRGPGGGRRPWQVFRHASEPATGTSALIPADTGHLCCQGLPSNLGLPGGSQPAPGATQPAPGASPPESAAGPPAVASPAAPAPAPASPAAPQSAANGEIAGLLGQVTKLIGDLAKLLPSFLDKAMKAAESTALRAAEKAGQTAADQALQKAAKRAKQEKAKQDKAKKAKQKKAKKSKAGGKGKTKAGSKGKAKATAGKAKAAGGAAKAGKASAKPQRGANGEIKTVTRSGKPIGASIAPAFDAMVAAARKDGVSLQVTSGYRSNAEQRRLWAANPNPVMVARPGTSNHEKGNAIDFANIGSAWTWLKKNATRFGFKNYPAERWHYDYVG